MTPTLEMTISLETETVIAVYTTAKTETTYTFPIDLEAKHVAGMPSPFNRVKSLKQLLETVNPDISKADVETFLDSKFAIERAKAQLAIADENLIFNYQEKARKDGTLARTIKANDKQLKKEDLLRMNKEKDILLARAESDKRSDMRDLLESLTSGKLSTSDLITQLANELG